MKKLVFLTALASLITVSAMFGQQRKLVGDIKRGTGDGADFYRLAALPDSSPDLIFYRSVDDEGDIWVNIDKKDV